MLIGLDVRTIWSLTRSSRRELACLGEVVPGQRVSAAAQRFAASSSVSVNVRACPGQRTLKIVTAGPAQRALVTIAIRSNGAGAARQLQVSQTASPSSSSNSGPST